MSPKMKTSVRPATPDDAPLLATLIDIAGEGMPSHLWAGMASAGQTPLEVGADRARREQGGFSWRNARIAEVGGEAVGMLLGYPLPQPTARDVADVARLPDMVRPLLELEHVAAGTWYVNALAVLAGRRGGGIGSVLLEDAAEVASATGHPVLSLQVFSGNAGALRLYRRHGFEQVDERPVLDRPGQRDPDERVLLMLRRP